MRTVLAVLAALLCVCQVSAQTTAFTYQGRLGQAGTPAAGTFDFRFTLFDAATGGAAVSVVACADDVFVTDGLFTVLVPLTAPVSGADAYLNIEVRAGGAGS